MAANDSARKRRPVPPGDARHTLELVSERGSQAALGTAEERNEGSDERLREEESE